MTALDTLKVTMPERYQHEPSGGWRCPPGINAAQAHGLFYRIRTDAQVHPLVIQNLKFLQDFWIHVYEVPPEQEAQALQLLTTAPGITSSTHACLRLSARRCALGTYSTITIFLLICLLPRSCNGTKSVSSAPKQSQRRRRRGPKHARFLHYRQTSGKAICDLSD